MSDPFQDFVNLELPQRPVLLTFTNTGYDGNPNNVGAPSKILNAPIGTFYLRQSTGSLWQRLTSSFDSWKLLDASVHGISNLNRDMQASITTTNGDLACGTALAATISTWVLVLVNGISYSVGDGSKLKNCYFSNDGGNTPRFTGDLVIGDLLYWNGSIAEFELSNSDVIDFIYDN